LINTYIMKAIQRLKFFLKGNELYILDLAAAFNAGGLDRDIQNDLHVTLPAEEAAILAQANASDASGLVPAGETDATSTVSSGSNETA